MSTEYALAIKLKKDIWFIPKETVFFYKQDKLYKQYKDEQPMRTLDSLHEAIMTHISIDDEDEYIEILDKFIYSPPKYISDVDGHRYKLVGSK